jgi:hypothetical protein
MADAPGSAAALAVYARHMEDRVRLPSSENALLSLHAEAKAAALVQLVGVSDEEALVTEVTGALEEYSVELGAGEGWGAEAEVEAGAEGGLTPCVQRTRLSGGLLHAHWVANAAASLTHCRRLMEAMSRPVLARVADGAFGDVGEVQITHTHIHHTTP